MRVLIGAVAGISLVAAIGVGFAPSGERAAALASARKDAIKQNERLRGMTNEFITKAYPEDPLLYCWARTTDCGAATAQWIAGVEDLRVQYRTAVVAEFPQLAPRIDTAEFRLSKRLGEIRELYVDNRPANRLKAYNTARDAASDAFVLYRAMPGEPNLVMTDTALALHRLKQSVGLAQPLSEAPSTPPSTASAPPAIAAPATPAPAVEAPRESAAHDSSTAPEGTVGR